MHSEIKNPGFRDRIALLVGNGKPFGWAERVGISKGAFARIWNEGTVPTYELLMRITSASGVNLHWLLTGEGERFVVIGEKTVDSAENADGFVRIPFYPGCKADDGAQDITICKISFRREWLDVRGLDSKKLAVVKMVGTSMEPTFSDGDHFIVDTRVKAPFLNSIYAISYGEEIRIKRLQPLMDGSIVVKGDNPSYQPETISRADAGNLKIVGRAVWAGKNL